MDEDLFMLCTWSLSLAVQAVREGSSSCSLTNDRVGIFGILRVNDGRIFGFFSRRSLMAAGLYRTAFLHESQGHCAL